MSQLQSTYDIQRPTGVCAATGRELEPGETVYAALVDPPAEERSEEQRKPNEKGELPMLRIDVSSEAWEDSEFRPPYLFGFWRAEVPEPNEKKKLLVGDAAIQELLLSMEDAKEFKQLAFRCDTFLHGPLMRHGMTPPGFIIAPLNLLVGAVDKHESQCDIAALCE